MTHTLISFLGKPAKDKSSGRYRIAHYDFDGDIETTHFFALGLKNVIQPDQLIILGTSASMWDVFLEIIAETEDQIFEQWSQLSDAVLADAVTQTELDAFAPLVSQHLGLTCQLCLIPYGINMEEQVETLKIMAQNVAPEETVSLDLTHGLRHLPMLGLLSAMYLQTAKKITIKGIYYGALDRTPQNDSFPKTPVMRLDGLLNIAEWITALHGFDKTGDIAPFSRLLQKEGLATETAELLQEAAFFEGVLNISKARSPLRKFAQQTQEGLPGIGTLFTDSLTERISWKDKENIYLRQREKAYFYLEQGDYVRAASLGFEAFISYRLKLNHPNNDIEDYQARDYVKDQLRTELKRELKTQEAYNQLRHIRNSVAHASRSKTKEAQQAFSSENNLKQTLDQLFSRLLPEQPH